jgi:hypothetical protein
MFFLIRLGFLNLIYSEKTTSVIISVCEKKLKNLEKKILKNFLFIYL